MGNMKEGDVWKCEVCNLEMQVKSPCDEEKCDLSCCGKNLVNTNN